MFLHKSRLPHVLEPASYCSDEQYQRELEVLFRPGWQIVGTIDELPRDGDFKTFELFGQPILLRRSGNQFDAYLNVCVHRHCLLTSASCGNSPRIRCQYHGWEYDRQGRTAHIPAPKNFVPWDRETNHLDKYRLETCGSLLFLSLNPAAVELTEYLEDGHATLNRLFSPPWRPLRSWTTTIDVNWKIPVENSLEGYHIPSVHARTFKVAPTPERTTHILGPSGTTFRTASVAPGRIEATLFEIENCLLRALRRENSRSYTHYHLFPNILVSSTDMFSLCVTATPLGPMRTQVDVRLFCYLPHDRHWFLRGCCAIWGRLNAALSKAILTEDFGIYPAIQRGLASSPHPGCLGAIEERVHAFQTFVHDRCSAGIQTALLRS